MIHRLLTTATLLLLAAPALAAAPAPADVAARVEAFYKERTDISAEFSQTVKKPGRQRAITKTGVVHFKRPGMMRWDYKKPEPVYYVSDGKVLWSYQPEDALVTRLDVQSSELYHQSRYLFGQGDLRQDFDLAGAAAEGGYALALTPKKSSRNFKKLTLVVDPATGEIKRTELIDPYDNVSTITFKQVEYKPLAAKVFEFSPPPGATVRDLSKPQP